MSAGHESVDRGLSLREFARRCGLSDKTALRYCRTGRIWGARKHPLTKKWWVFPPAKLLFP